ncbi:MAG: PilZ domain-containing protein [Spirochaetes bacterium]|nr:PilZ domain-containing protein [Spirochaetota bacterium]
MKEKRHYIRINTDFVVWAQADMDTYNKYFIYGGLAAKNLGGGGILIETDESMAIGMLLELKFYIPNSDAIEAIGQIMRVEKTSKSKFEVGIKFTTLEKDDKKNIINFCKRNSKKPVKKKQL